MKRSFILTVLAALLLLPACDSFVEEVDRPKDSAGGDQLNNPDQVPFILNGVRAQWADATDFTTLAASLLSDQFRFGINGDATFPTYFQLDSGIPERQSNTVDAAFNALGQYRFLADDAVRRINNIEFGDEAPVSKSEALFTAHLHGAVARYYMATYFGLNPREGGGVIDRSDFIPSNAMYDSAAVKVDAALSQSGLSERQQKIANSVLAKIELYDGDYSEAATAAANGLQEGDAPFEIKYSVQDTNEWWSNAGRGRVQVVAQDGAVNPNVEPSYRTDINIRDFRSVVAENPGEQSRTTLVGVTEGAGFTDSLTAEDAIEFAQDKYPSEGAPIPFVNWEEMNLIRAELAARGASDGNPTDLVNAVRSSFGLDELSDAGNLETIAVERDRTLFAQGDRLVDQRRFDFIPWHLNESFQNQTTWKYIPISQAELDDNPNLNPSD